MSDALFTTKPQGSQTEVTWIMTGKNNFIAKAFCLFMNRNKMIGDQFEQGLVGLKPAVETEVDGRVPRTQPRGRPPSAGGDRRPGELSQVQEMRG